MKRSCLLEAAASCHDDDDCGADEECIVTGLQAAQDARGNEGVIAQCEAAR